VSPKRLGCLQGHAVALHTFGSYMRLLTKSLTCRA